MIRRIAAIVALFTIAALVHAQDLEQYWSRQWFDTAGEAGQLQIQRLSEAILGVRPDLSAQRGYIELREALRIGATSITSPRLEELDREDHALVDIQVGAMSGVPVFIQVIPSNLQTFIDPPADALAPDMGPVQQALSFRRIEMQQCQAGTCTRYCRRGGRWYCCEYSCRARL